MQRGRPKPTTETGHAWKWSSYENRWVCIKCHCMFNDHPCMNFYYWRHDKPDIDYNAEPACRGYVKEEKRV